MTALQRGGYFLAVEKIVMTLLLCHVAAIVEAYRSSSVMRITRLQATLSTFESHTDQSSSAPLPNLEQRRPLKVALLATAARTNRGELANDADKSKAMELISKLESLNPIPDPALSSYHNGAWELVYSSTFLFKVSPLFLAARAVCKDGDEAERFNYFCKLHKAALAWTQIGKVTQTITDTSLVNSFATSGSPFLGLPGPFVSGVITSSADIESKTGSELTLFMDKVKILDSNVPFLRDFLDTFEGLPTRSLSSVLESAISLKAPKPKFFVTYVDTHMRICRDQDDEVFVFNRV